MENNYCVIMAGGVGSRFWPMSRTELPKQFLDILGTGRTLIQQTYDRFTSICAPEHFLVVTNAIYKDLVLEQLPNLKEDQVLCEPMMRNTAPCIAYATWKIKKEAPNAAMVVTPADHLILKQEAFEKVINTAIKSASEADQLITLGIKPTRPDTGYGYIETDPTENLNNEDAIKKVTQFREKPDLETAKAYVERGNFSWNSGMFIWKVSSIESAFNDLLPEVAERFQEGADKLGTQKESAFIAEIYPSCTSISIDYAILEKANNVYTLSADIGWSDLGTWGSVYEHLDHDANGNAVVGKRVVLSDTQNCLINVPANKVVATKGVQDLIIVDAHDTLLIINKKDEQAIKQLRALVGDQLGEQHI